MDGCMSTVLTSCDPRAVQSKKKKKMKKGYIYVLVAIGFVTEHAVR